MAGSTSLKCSENRVRRASSSDQAPAAAGCVWPSQRKQNLVQAVGYVRTSSAGNIGRDKDSERRQRLAIERFAKTAGYAVVDWFNDPAVSGADPIESRPGFAALLNRIEGNGVRIVLVGDASRFARDLMAQELGIGGAYRA